MRLASHQWGALLYGLWGVLHVTGGAAILAADARAQIGMFGTAMAAAGGMPEPGPVVHAALSFHAFNLLWLGLLTTIVAAALNWRNSLLGYWLNLAIVGAADLGLIVFLLAPGYMALSDGWPGPVLWVGAVVFSTLGLLSARKGGPAPT